MIPATSVYVRETNNGDAGSTPARIQHKFLCIRFGSSIHVHRTWTIVFQDGKPFGFSIDLAAAAEQYPWLIERLFSNAQHISCTGHVRLNAKFGVFFPPSDARHCGEMDYSTTPCRRLPQRIDITNIAVTRQSRFNAAIEFNDVEICINQRRRQRRSHEPSGTRDENTIGQIPPVVPNEIGSLSMAPVFRLTLYCSASTFRHF